MDYPPDLHCVLKVENNSNKPFNIRGIFSNAGEIPQLYPYNTGIPGQFHYFIEYQRRGSTDRALQLRLGSSAGLLVYPIHSNHHLVEQFRSCKAYGSSRQFTGQGDAAICPPSPTDFPSAPPQDSRSAVKSSQKGRVSESETLNLLSALSSQHGPGDSVQHPTANTLSNESSMSNPTHTSSSTNEPVSTLHTQKALDASPVSFSLDSRLFIDIQGQHIVYDLAKDPEQDPKIVIDLLKLSSSERGNWMVAGAHFRRIGKPRAAIDIMYAMLEVLVNNGFTEAKLKPVFLLLSGCELDMAICARNAGDLAASEQHYANVQMWLQKVYGTTPPATLAQPPTSLVSSVVVSNRVQPEPSQPMEIDHVSPQESAAESMIGRKRRMEECSSVGRNTRRRNSGPPRSTKRSKEKGRYFSNKENWRFR